MVTHVFFDFFGTLVDYDPRPVGTPRNAPLADAAAAGIDITADAADALWATSWAELDAHADATGREWALADVVDRFRSRLGRPARAFPPTQETIDAYLATWTQAVTPAPGLESCLQDLSRDHRLVVVSNTHDPRLVPDLAARFGIAGYVEAIVSSVDVGWRKPHPEIFRVATDTVGAEPGNVVFVGDSWGPDVAGPLAAGMHAVFVGAPATVRDATVPVVDSLYDLPAAVRAVRSTSARRR